MPNLARRTVALAVLAVAVIAAAVALDLPSVSAQSDEQTGRIVARRLDDGRTEFAWQPSGGERVLPRLRYFPASVGHNRWLNSSPIEVDGEEIGRINVRLADDGRLEFAFTPPDGERIEPQARYFPAGARVGRWLRSTEIAIGAVLAPPATGFVAISAGQAHTCAIHMSGEIECWGSNVGTVLLVQKDEEVNVTEVRMGQLDAPPGPFRAVSAGAHHTCAIRESMEIACWGDDFAGGSTAPAGRFTAVSADYCAIRESGEIECWGGTPFHDSGQTDAPAGRFTAVSTSGAHTCAIRESGEIECWGSNDYGQLDAPAGSFSAVSTSSNYACGLRTDGAIECWGTPFHDSGQTDAPAGRFTAVSASGERSCAIRESGEIACWGRDFAGRLAAPAGRFTAVSTGGVHTCAIRESGEIECWGSNDKGQLDAPVP